MQYLDIVTCDWYREKAQKEIDRLVQALRSEMTEEETRKLRARIKAFEELRRWTPDPLIISDEELKFL